MDDTTLRLAFVDLAPHVGRAARMMWELALGLPRDRFELHAWLSPDSGKDDLAAALEQTGVVIERVSAAASGWDLKSRLGMWQRARKLKPQLFHVHLEAGSDPALTARVVEGAGPTPLLLTLHEARVLEAAPSPAFRSLVARAAVITVPCAHDGDQVVRRMGRERASVRVIPPGATLPDESEILAARRIRDALGVRPGRPLWVAPLRLETGRGHDVLLRALAEVHRRGLPFLAVLPGAGPLKPLLADTAESLGLAGLVSFDDAVDHLGPLLTAADAVIFPVMGGPIPFSLLDAMARERVVVASDVPAVREALATADPHALADALEMLHRRPGDAVLLGREAARQVEETLRWERVIDACEESYDEVLGLATFAPGEESRR